MLFLEIYDEKHQAEWHLYFTLESAVTLYNKVSAISSVWIREILNRDRGRVIVLLRLIWSLIPADKKTLGFCLTWKTFQTSLVSAFQFASCILCKLMGFFGMVLFRVFMSILGNFYCWFYCVFLFCFLTFFWGGGGGVVCLLPEYFLTSI